MSIRDIAASMATQARISILKAKARTHYLAYINQTDNMSCGRALAEAISGGVLHSKLGFNRVMDELAEIDPATPAARL